MCSTGPEHEHLVQAERAWGDLADPRTKGDWAKLYVASTLGRETTRIRGSEALLFFIGYARSGHTLIASMLNAHPEV